MLILLEVAAIVGRQSHSSFDREFLHQVHGIGDEDYSVQELVHTSQSFVVSAARSSSYIKQRFQKLAYHTLFSCRRLVHGTLVYLL